MALFDVLLSIFLTILLGGVLSLLRGNFIESCKAMFLIFFAFPCVAAILLLSTKIPEDWTLGFGAGLYYGTLVVSALLGEAGLSMSDQSDQLVLGFIFTALVCYIIYLKKNSA